MTHSILIVEDNPIDRKLFEAVLRTAGFEVSLALDATDAGQKLRGLLPDLILVDIVLPGMDGLSFTRHCKSDERLRHIPIVALTARAMSGDEQRGFAAGCNGYITKPIDTRSLVKSVREFVAR